MSSISRLFLRVLGAVAGVLALSGMTCGPTDPSPCELDRFGCEEPEPIGDFYLASCPDDVSGPLDVAVGTGESKFTAFTAGAGPVVNYGPQGGQHVFMGVHVANARIDISPRMKLRFYLGQGAGCGPPVEPDGAIPTCAVALGQRQLELGSPGFELHTNAAGQVEEYGLVVFVGVPATDVPSLVAVTVEDQCHRIGTSYQPWTVY